MVDVFTGKDGVGCMVAACIALAIKGTFDLRVLPLESRKDMFY